MLYFYSSPHEAVNKIVEEINRLHQDKNKVFLVAFDGRSGTGKSTLASQVAEKVKGVVVVGDDFYSGGNDDRWKECGAQFKVDKVIDWKKMRTEVLEPLKAGKSASWHPLDFEPEKGWVGWKDELIKLNPSEVIIVEGAYAARPELRDIIDLSILIEATDEIRRKKLKDREGELFMAKWHGIWDEAEDLYFKEISPRSSFNIVIQLF
jgi:uridine kinase